MSHWTGILTVVVKTPASADILRRNPLGLYVDAIDWSRELEPAASIAPPATPALSSGVPVTSLAPIEPALAAPLAQPPADPSNQETQP
jgi:type IV secretion system protein VirB5